VRSRYPTMPPSRSRVSKVVGCAVLNYRRELLLFECLSHSPAYVISDTEVFLLVPGSPRHATV